MKGIYELPIHIYTIVVLYVLLVYVLPVRYSVVSQLQSDIPSCPSMSVVLSTQHLGLSFIYIQLRQGVLYVLITLIQIIAYYNQLVVPCLACIPSLGFITCRTSERDLFSFVVSSFTHTYLSDLSPSNLIRSGFHILFIIHYFVVMLALLATE